MGPWPEHSFSTAHAFVQDAFSRNGFIQQVCLLEYGLVMKITEMVLQFYELTSNAVGQSIIVLGSGLEESPACLPF